MKSYLRGLTMHLESLMRSLDTESNMKVVARELAVVELKLQACRSLFEARLMEAEIKNLQAVTPEPRSE